MKIFKILKNQIVIHQTRNYLHFCHVSPQNLRVDQDNSELLDNQRQQLGFNLFLLIAACTGYTLGLDTIDSSSCQINTNTCDTCLGDVSAWVEHLIFMILTECLHELLELFVIQNHILSQLNIAAQHTYYREPKSLFYLSTLLHAYLFYLTYSGSILYEGAKDTCLGYNKPFYAIMVVGLMLCYFWLTLLFLIFLAYLIFHPTLMPYWNTTPQSQDEESTRNVQLDRKRGSASDDVCSICLGEYTCEEYVSVLPCGGGRHVFHTQCIERWLLKSNRCPLCKELIS